MSAILERVRAILAPEYEVEAELGRGGMGMVFRARDTRLERFVAIKILRPELASAHAAERFKREAQLLAQLKHQNVVPVYDVNERDGIPYYVMAYLDGETLGQRLSRGSLAPRRAVQIVRDVLAGLEAVHARGILHRDIKPDNILLEEERAILTDFGIAKSVSDGAAPLTTPGDVPGTIEYMPPEQRSGDEVTTRTDLYAVAMVLYESITGRRWVVLARPQDADWRGVPRRTRRALCIALAWAPADRFADAAQFQRALWVPRRRAPVWPAAAVIIIAGGLISAFAFCEPLGLCSQGYELIVEPFAAQGVTSPQLGRNLATIVTDNLSRFPQIRLVPKDLAFRRWEDSIAGRSPPAVAVRMNVRGVVAQEGEQTLVRLEMRDSLNRRLHSAQFVSQPGAEVAVSDSIVLQLLRWIHPELLDRYGPRPMWSPKPAALAEFLDGEDAFRRDAWSDAARHFREALQVDPTFARAAWRLANAQRWRRMPPGVDLHALLGQSHFLTPLDSLLITAELAPHGEPRYRVYQQALALFPTDPYARLLYGAELMHRGPLAGIPLDSAAAVLQEAVNQDPYLAPAQDQLVWALIRLGLRDSARHSLDRLEQLRRRDSGEGADLSIAPSLEIAFAARFAPESLPAMPADVQSDVARMARFGLAFDVPDMQLALGRRLPGAAGHQAQGLALMALGRPAEAVAHFDSTAQQLEALEWRVLPAALGFPGIPAIEEERGRRGLAAAALRTGVTAARAAWASAVDAYARGDSATARHWRSRLRAIVTGGGRLDVLLAGLELAARGNLDAALTRTAPLLAFDEWQYLDDPFARAVLHVRRADWLLQRGRSDLADRALLWYENSDFTGWLSDTLQAAEIDWALSTWSRWRRGRCASLGRALELWRHAEASHDSLRATAQRQRAAARCPQ